MTTPRNLRAIARIARCYPGVQCLVPTAVQGPTTVMRIPHFVQRTWLSTQAPTRQGMGGIFANLPAQNAQEQEESDAVYRLEADGK